MILQPFAFIIWHMSDQTALWNIKQASSIFLLCSLLNLWDNIPQKNPWKFLISPGSSQRLLVVLGGWIQWKKGKCSLLWNCVAFHTSCEKQNNKSRKQPGPLSVYKSAFTEWAAHNKWIERDSARKTSLYHCVITFWCRHWQYCGGSVTVPLHPEPSSEGASVILTWRSPAVSLAGRRTQCAIKSLVN